jgi:hypothetical protein
MSDDYSLFNPIGPGPMDSWPAVAPEPLGTLDEVKGRLAALFPEVWWRESAGAWFGREKASGDMGMGFQIGPEEDGRCRFLTVRHVTRAQVEELCRRLGVVAVDAQKVELIRP